HETFRPGEALRVRLAFSAGHHKGEGAGGFRADPQLPAVPFGDGDEGGCVLVRFAVTDQSHGDVALRSVWAEFRLFVPETEMTTVRVSGRDVVDGFSRRGNHPRHRAKLLEEKRISHVLAEHLRPQWLCRSDRRCVA